MAVPQMILVTMLTDIAERLAHHTRSIDETQVGEKSVAVPSAPSTELSTVQRLRLALAPTDGSDGHLPLAPTESREISELKAFTELSKALSLAEDMAIVVARNLDHDPRESFTTIGHALGISKQSAATRYKRARQRLSALNIEDLPVETHAEDLLRAYPHPRGDR